MQTSSPDSGRRRHLFSPGRKIKKTRLNTSRVHCNTAEYNGNTLGFETWLSKKKLSDEYASRAYTSKKKKVKKNKSRKQCDGETHRQSKTILLLGIKPRSSSYLVGTQPTSFLSKRPEVDGKKEKKNP